MKGVKYLFAYSHNGKSEPKKSTYRIFDTEKELYEYAELKDVHTMYGARAKVKAWEVSGGVNGDGAVQIKDFNDVILSDWLKENIY
jgi:hypothetical protein